MGVKITTHRKVAPHLAVSSLKEAYSGVTEIRRWREEKFRGEKKLFF